MSVSASTQQLSFTNRLQATKVATTIYPLLSLGISKNHQLCLATKVAPDLPGDMIELCVHVVKSCYVQARRDALASLSKICAPKAPTSEVPPRRRRKTQRKITCSEHNDNAEVTEDHQFSASLIYIMIEAPTAETTPTTSPYGSAIDTRPDEHPTQSVDGSSAQAEHLTSTPSRTKIPLTNDPVVKRRAETYQRTNVSTPAYEEHGTPAFQGLFSEATIDEQHPSSEAYQSNQVRSTQYYRPPLAKHDDDDRDEREEFETHMHRRFQEFLKRENWLQGYRARREEQPRREGTSESRSNHGSDWNDRDEHTRSTRDHSGGRSANWFRLSSETWRTRSISLKGQSGAT